MTVAEMIEKLRQIELEHGGDIALTMLDQWTYEDVADVVLVHHGDGSSRPLARVTSVCQV